MSAKIKQYGKILVLVALLLAVAVMAGLAVTWSTAQTEGTATEPVLTDTEEYTRDNLSVEPFVKEEKPLSDSNDPLLEGEAENVLSKKVYELEDRRNENCRIWQVEREVEIVDPGTKEKLVDTIVTDIVEMGNGICYQDEGGGWQVTVPHWRATQDGFVMDTAGYQLAMGRNIGSWLRCTAGGEEMQLRPSVVEAGNDYNAEVVAKLVSEVEGYIDPEDPSRLVFEGAFGKEIDLELVARSDGYGQNVIFHNQPNLPRGMELSKSDISIRTELNLDTTTDGDIKISLNQQEGMDWRKELPAESTLEEIEIYKEVDEEGGKVRQVCHQFAASRVYDDSGEMEIKAFKKLQRGRDDKTYLVETLEGEYLEQANYPVTWDYETKYGSLTSNTVWYAKSTYYISDNLLVNGCTLWIEPGTVVKFNNAKKISTSNGGVIIAQGNPHMPIVFTSKYDADNGEAVSSGTLTAGIYQGLEAGANSAFEFCRVQWASVGIKVLGQPVVPIQHCYFHACSTGISIPSDYSSTEELLIFNNLFAWGTAGMTGIKVDGSVGDIVIRNNSFRNNTRCVDILSGCSRTISIENNLFAEGSYGIYNNSSSVDLTNQYNGYFQATDVGTTPGAGLVTCTVNPYHYSVSGVWTRLGWFWLNDVAGGGAELINAGNGTVGDVYGDYREWAIHHVAEGGTVEERHGFSSDVTIAEDTVWQPNYATCDTGIVAIGCHFPRVDYVVYGAGITFDEDLTWRIEPGTVIAYYGNEDCIRLYNRSKMICNGDPYDAEAPNDGYITWVYNLRTGCNTSVKYPYYNTDTGLYLNGDYYEIRYNRFWSMGWAVRLFNGGLVRDSEFLLTRTGIYLSSYQDIRVANCLFEGNYFGIMPCNYQNATLFCDLCTFDHNSYGFIPHNTAIKYDLKNSLFTLNTYGIYHYQYTGSYSINYNTFYSSTNYSVGTLPATNLTLAANPYNATWSGRDRFYLNQSYQPPCAIDGGLDPDSRGMPGYTTDYATGAYDAAPIDIGYHYLAPSRADSEDMGAGDGLYDDEEYWHGTDYLVSDTDNDGMPDGWEVANGLNPLVNDASRDPDRDGLTNEQEYAYETSGQRCDPQDSDSDGDGMPDGWEYTNGLNPLTNDALVDSDNDGHLNLSEYLHGSDPTGDVNSIPTANTTITVPTQTGSIQTAINWSIDGDEVVLLPGTYYEYDVDFSGKAITLRSTNPDDWQVVEDTIIDANYTPWSHGVDFDCDEDSNSILSGITIQNAQFVGINCEVCLNPVINRCIIRDCGNGVTCYEASPTIEYCKIYNSGYGISCCFSSAPIIKNNWIYGNSDFGIYCLYAGNTIIRNNTIVNNDWGISLVFGTAPSISNCIIWSIDDDLYNCSATFSCIKDGDGVNDPSTHNIADDPLFVDPNNYDYHLMIDSPCIDSGNTAGIVEEQDIDGDERVNRSAVDIGADECNWVHNITQDTYYGWIQDAIEEANDGDVIVAYEGIFREKIDFLGKAITVRSTNPDDPACVAATIIDGGCDAASPGSVVTFADNENSYSVLLGLTITGGYASGEGGGIKGTGAVSPTIRKCVIRSNHATGNGGGIYNCGGLISECTITENTSDAYGGGLSLCDGRIEDCLINGNSSASGGGGMNDCRADVTGCTFASNTTVGTGGGLRGNNDGRLRFSTIRNCLFQNNTCNTSAGGGIWGYDGLISGCVFTGNSAKWGGGFAVCHNRVENCLIVNNTALNAGGINNSDGQLVNCTVVGNTATSGGGGAVEGCDGTITNCIIWDNHTPAVFVNCLATISYSCWPGAGSTNGNISSDPLLVNPDYEDYHITSSSPCVDTGTNIPAGGLPATDLEGKWRPLDGNGEGTYTADMGCYEAGEEPAAIAYYVDAVNGVDNDLANHDGLTPETAFQTVSYAIGQARVIKTTINVLPGTYNENLNLGGKFITITSTNPDQPEQTIIDGDGTTSVVTFAGGENANTILCGFTITGGSGVTLGGGIVGNNTNTNPSISQCVITGNSSTSAGGGIWGCGGKISRCVFFSNTTVYGGAIAACHGTIVSCLIYNNQASYGGGFNNCDGTIINCTITQNTTTTQGVINGCDGNITNCIVWGNTPDTFTEHTTGVITYCCWPEGTGTGNIDDDPLFAAAASDDYHLQANSPCLDAGQPGCYQDQLDLDGNLRCLHDRVDIGAYEVKIRWYVNQNIANPGNGLSWETALDDLQTALQDKAGAGDDIWVAGGTYLPATNTADRSATFQLLPYLQVYGGFAGTEATLSERDLSISTNQTILSGDIDLNDNGEMPGTGNSYHVVTGADHVILDGFAITGGNANDVVAGSLGGGGMLNNYVNNVKVNNCYFLQNIANYPCYGAGINNANSTIHLTNCIVSHNSVVGVTPPACRGAGIYNQNSNIKLINCTLCYNLGDRGAGLYVVSGMVEIYNSIFWNNWSSTEVCSQDVQMYIEGGSILVKYSCIQDGTPGESPYPLGGMENNNIDLNPIFDEFYMPSGSRIDLQAGSPCIDAGDNTVVPSGIVIDLAGEARFVDDPATADSGNGDAPIVDMGAYEFQPVTENHNPVADAGEDQTVVDSDDNGLAGVTLNGSASHDPDPGDTIISYVWKEGDKGLGSGETLAADLSIGTHRITLTVTDQGGLPGTDEVLIEVQPATIQVEAGENRTVGWLVDAIPVTLYDARVWGRTPGTYTTIWSKESMPVGCTVDFDSAAQDNQAYSYEVNPAIILSVNPFIFNYLPQVVFALKLTATEIATNISAEDTVFIVVTQNSFNASQQPPQVDAGGPYNVSAPMVSIDLDGTVTDDGLPFNNFLSIRWSMVGYDFPSDITKEDDDLGGEVLFDNAAAEDPGARFTQPGSYIIKLCASDGQLSHESTALVTVAGLMNKPPVVDAGSNRNIPTVPCSLDLMIVNTGETAPSVDDDDNQRQPLQLTWSVVQGPVGGAIFANRHPNSATPGTTVTFSKPGTYILELAANDGQYTTTDCVTIKVNAKPEVEAGANKLATLEDHSPNGIYAEVTMSDARIRELQLPLGDMTILWELSSYSGPQYPAVTQGDFITWNPDKLNQHNPTFKFLAEGVYELQLSASDNGIAGTSDTVRVSIRPVQQEYKTLYAITYQYPNGENGPEIQIYDINESNGTLIDNPSTVFCDGERNITEPLKNITFSKKWRMLFALYDYSSFMSTIHPLAMWPICEQKMPNWNFLGNEWETLIIDDEKDVIYSTGDGPTSIKAYVWNESQEEFILLHDHTIDFLPYGFSDFALDAENGLLYVADATNIIKILDTENWCHWVDKDIPVVVDKEEMEVSVIAIDTKNHFLYSGSEYDGNWPFDIDGHNYLVQTNLNNRDDQSKIDLGANVTGITVDQETGLVYCITKANKIYVYDSALDKKQEIETTNNSDDPAGLTLAKNVKYKPSIGTLSISHQEETIGSNPVETPITVSPTNVTMDEFTYHIAYTIDSELDEQTDTVVVDYLPVQVEYAWATDPGVYDKDEHAVKWYLGNVTPSSSGTFQVGVKVNGRAAPNSNIINHCEIESSNLCTIAKDANVHVNWWLETNRIYVDDNAIGGNGSSWPLALNDLQDALALARYYVEGEDHLWPNGGEIWVADGYYCPGDKSNDTFQLVAGVRMYGGFEGTESALDQRNLIDPEKESILTGNDCCSKVVTTEDNTVIDGFTIQNAKDPFGAGIYCCSSYATIQNNKIINNFQNGITCENAVHPSIKNNWIYGNWNRYTNPSGGGIQFTNTVRASVFNNCITNNGGSMIGFGIKSDAGSEISVSNCIIWGNDHDAQDNSYELSSTITPRFCCIKGYPTIADGNGNFGKEPKFVDYTEREASGDYEYYIYDLRLQPGSPCIDKGFEDTINSEDEGSISVDGSISWYNNDDVIEIDNDETPRIITVSGEAITFVPPLEEETDPVGMTITNWMHVWNFEDSTTAEGTTSSLVVADVSRYHVHDTIKFTITINQIDNIYYVVVANVDTSTNTVYFDSVSPLIAPVPDETLLHFWSIVSERDILGGPRKVGGHIDMGAHESTRISVDAGADREIPLTSESVDVWLDDTALTYLDTDHTDVELVWSVISGPAGGYDFNGQATGLNPTVTFTEEGNYVLRLLVQRASDDIPLYSDTVNIRIYYGGQAGYTHDHVADDKEFTLNVGFPAVTPSKIRWTGPDGVSFDPSGDITPQEVTATLSAAVPGIYDFKVEALDSSNNVIGWDKLKVPVSHQQILVDAGSYNTITWPDHQVCLLGMVSGGVPAAVHWQADEDAAGHVTIESPDTLYSWVKFDQPGRYELEFLAYDDYGDVIGADVAIVTVAPAAHGPVTVNLGNDQVITFPQDFAFLTGHVTGLQTGDTVDLIYSGTTNPEVSVVTFSHQIPDDGIFATKATFRDVNGESMGGEYQFSLVASDAAGVILGVDTMTVRVDFPKIVDAGEDVVLEPGQATLALAGKIAAGTAWDTVKWLGNSDGHVSFSADSILAPTATFTVPGVYKLGLVVRKVINNINTIVGMDTIQVTAPYSTEEVVVDAGHDCRLTALGEQDIEIALHGKILSGDPDSIAWIFPDPSSNGIPGNDEIEYRGSTDTLDTWLRIPNPGVYPIALVAYKGENIVGWDMATYIVDKPDTSSDITVDIGTTYEALEVGGNVTLSATISGCIFQWIYTELSNVYLFVDNSTPQSPSATATFYQPGVYDFSLVLRNPVSNEIIGLDTIQITVLPEDQRDWKLASSLEEITLGTNNSVSLTGTTTHQYNSVVWVDPTSDNRVEFTPNSEDPLEASACFYNINDDEYYSGIYKLGYVAKDENVVPVGCDTITIKVNPRGHHTIEAGEKQEVTLSLDGRAVVALDGTIDTTSCKWFTPVLVDGTVTFDDGDPATTNDDQRTETRAVFTAPGSYKLALLAYSGESLIGADTLTVTVHPYDSRSLYMNMDAIDNEITYLADDSAELQGTTIKGGRLAKLRWLFNNDPSNLVSFADYSFLNTTATILKPGIYSVILDCLWGDTVVGQRAVQVKVKEPQVRVDAKVNLGGNPVQLVDEYCQLLGTTFDVNLTAQVFGVSDTSILTYKWFSSDSTNAAISNPGVWELTKQLTVNTAGKYEITLEAWSSDNKLLSRDKLLVIALSGTPIVEAGQYDSVIKSEGLILSKAQIWDDTSVFNDTDHIQWTSDRSVTIDTTSSGCSILQPGVIFNDINNDGIGLYKLTLGYRETLESDYVVDEVTVLVEPTPISFVYAGAQKFTSPYHPIEMNDVNVISSKANLTYAWEVTAGESGNVTFDSPSQKNPVITFLAEGDYTLTLSVSYGTFPPVTSTVDINVVKFYSDGDPFLALTAKQGDTEITNGHEVCGSNIEIEVNAEYAHTDSVCLILDNDDNKEIKPYDLTIHQGSADLPEKMMFHYLLDTHTISSGSHILSASAKGTSVYDPDPVSFTFTNSCAITDYKVSQEVVNNDPSTLTFSATFTSSLNWQFEICNVNDLTGTPRYTESSSVASSEITIPVTIGNWGNGTYRAHLKVDNGGSTLDEADVCFSVAIGDIKDKLVAELDGSLKFGPEDLGGVGIPIKSRYMITKGFFDLQGKAYHPDFPDDVSYQITISDGKGTSQNITPGILANGYRHASVKPEGDDPYGSLGVLDLTSLPNGIYKLDLAVKCLGVTRHDTAEIALDCPLKIGNVKFSQEDLTIPVAGFPLQVVRTYDSFSRQKDGDFGFGWSYTLADMDIVINKGITQQAGVISGLSRDVTLTLPDGRRATFTSYLDGRIYSTGKGSWTVKYQSPEGVNGSLEATGTTTLKYEPLSFGWFWDGYQPPLYEMSSYMDLSMHEFEGFTLSMDDGTIYNINRYPYNDSQHLKEYGEDIAEELFGYTNGGLFPYEDYGKPYLASIKLASDETIVFEPDFSRGGENPDIKNVKCYAAGVEPDQYQSNYIQSIEIFRNTLGRIIAINAPAETETEEEPVNGSPTLVYDYDSDGNLVSVSKLITRDDPETTDKDETKYETTTYAYDSDNIHYSSDHYVTDIKDPRGLSPIQYLYDASGRLIGTRDARNKTIEVHHDLVPDEEGFRTETVVDRNGYPTVYKYNERGNVVKQVKTLPAEPVNIEIVTSYNYIDPANPDSPTSVTQLVPDPAVPGQFTDSITSTTYDAKGRPLSVTDPEGNVTVNTYDLCGNLLSTTQKKPGGDVVSVTYNHYNSRNLLVFSGTKANSSGPWLDLNVNYYDEYNRLWHTVKVDVNHLDPIPFNERIDSNATISNPAYFDALYDDVSGNAVLNNIEYHVITTYTYPTDQSGNYLSGSADQPYSISEPYHGAATYNSELEKYINHFQYDDNGNQYKSWYLWDAPAGQPDLYVITLNEYDAQNRVIKTRRIVADNLDGQNPVSDVTLSETIYNSIGKVESAEGEHLPGEHGSLTEYYYDELGNLVETNTYDPQGNLLTASRTLYDADGRALVTVGPYATGDQPVGTETVYDALGRVTETRRWANVAITLQDIHDASSWLVGKAATGWTTAGNQAVAGNELSYTKTIYDIAGRVAMTLTLDEEGYEQPTGYKYDKAGKQIAVADAKDYGLIKGTHYTYDNPWYVINESVLANLLQMDIAAISTASTTDYQGTRQWKVTDDRGNTTEFTYDALGRIIMTTFPATTQNPITYAHVTYDGLGRKIFESEQTTQINPDNAVGKEFEYDASGRLSAVVLAAVPDSENGNVLTCPRYEYKYDDFGNQIEIWDKLKQDPLTGVVNDTYKRITKFTYNELHQQTSRQLPGTQTEYKEYDEFGRIRKATDFDGQVAGYVYNDADNGLLSEVRYYADEMAYQANHPAGTFGLKIGYTYDKLGRKVTETIDDTQTWTYYYDAEGRIEAIVNPQGIVGYEYSDITGRKGAVVVPESLGSSNHRERIEYGYDEIGRLSDVEAVKRGGAGISELTHYQYDAAGSLEMITYPTGTTTDYDYDELNRLTSVTNRNSQSQTLSSFIYTLNDNGSRDHVVETMGGQAATIEWDYDALGRLARETCGSDYTDYISDLVGNRLTKKFNGATMVTYQYDTFGNDRLLLEDNATGEDVAYEYYDNGALKKKTVGSIITNYGYDLRGCLTSLSGGVNTTYAYDPAGIRVSAGSTTYLIDPYNPTGYAQVFKKITGTEEITYTIGNDVISQADATGIAYLIYDGHGSVRQLVDNTGSLVTGQQFNYDAYGNLTNTVSPQTNLLYAGEQWDTALRMYYLRARYYDPANGRFNALDPFAGNSQDPISLHKYLYCHADPINYVDLSGYNEFSITGLMGNIIARVVVFTIQHPHLAAGIGIAFDIMMPAVWQEAMIGSGIPPFQLAGNVGRVGKGFLRTIYASKHPSFKQIMDHWNKSAAGKLAKVTGDEFEKFFEKYMPNAVRNARVGQGKNTVDFSSPGYLVEIKSGISSFNEKQLAAITQEAGVTGQTIVYLFLEDPPSPVTQKIVGVGGNVISLYKQRK